MLKNILIAAGIISLAACGGGSSGGDSGSTSGGSSSGTTQPVINSPIESGLFYDIDPNILVMIEPSSNGKVAFADLNNGDYTADITSAYVDNVLDLFEYNFFNGTEFRTISDNQVVITNNESILNISNANLTTLFSVSRVGDEVTNEQFISIVEDNFPSVDEDNCRPIDSIFMCFTRTLEVDPDTMVIHFVEEFANSNGLGTPVIRCDISGQVNKVSDQYYVSENTSYVDGCDTGEEFNNVELHMGFAPVSDTKGVIMFAYYDDSDPDKQAHHVKWALVDL